MSHRNGANTAASEQVNKLKVTVAGMISVKTKIHVPPSSMTLDQLIRKASKLGIAVAISYATNIVGHANG